MVVVSRQSIMSNGLLEFRHRLSELHLERRRQTTRALTSRVVNAVISGGEPSATTLLDVITPFWTATRCPHRDVGKQLFKAVFVGPMLRPMFMLAPACYSGLRAADAPPRTPRRGLNRLASRRGGSRAPV
jgi:hypothetical protein